MFIGGIIQLLAVWVRYSRSVYINTIFSSWIQAIYLIQITGYGSTCSKAVWGIGGIGGIVRIAGCNGLPVLSGSKLIGVNQNLFTQVHQNAIDDWLIINAVITRYKSPYLWPIIF